METTQNIRPTSFRVYLQQELIRRCDRNPNYSLRSFAKSLAISSSALSGILNGKRPLTEKTAVRLAAALGLPIEEIEALRQSHQGSESNNVQTLTLDAFACISEWYHLAILELIRTKSFQPNPAWVARSLGLNRSQVNTAIERLQRVGLLRVEKDGSWIDCSANGKLTAIHESLTNAAAMLNQKRILELGIQAINEVPVDRRNNTAMTIAVDSADLPEARRRIQKFRRELANFFEKSSSPEHVYHLAIALYPLTKIEN
jgi:uncharacterized protein (TIGR02147 family)